MPRKRSAAPCDVAEARAAPGSPLVPRWVDPGVLAAAGVALAAASWGRWADPFVDFGRELYVAWRLAEGAVLYRDLAYFNGPLSPYVNAALFRIFGESTWTLYAGNLALLAGVAALVRGGLVQLAGRWPALLGTLFYLAVFAFGQYMWVGSFNFVAPYSHEMTHGTLLSLVVLAAFFAWLEKGSRGAATACGGALGLVLLTKVEFALAVAGAVLAGLAATLWSLRRPRSEVLKAAAWLALGATLAPSAAWLTLRIAADSATASEAIAGPWRHLANPEVRSLAFYRHGLGVDAPLRNIVSAVSWLAGSAAALATGGWMAYRLRRRRDTATSLAFLVLPGTLLLAVSRRLDWTGCARQLPWALVALVAGLTVRLARQRRAGQAAEPRQLQLLVAGVFALLLLSKMVLNTRFDQYGFALAMPGAVLVVALLAGELLPERFALASARRWFRNFVTSLVMAVLMVHLAVGLRAWRGQRITFVSGSDGLVGDARARFLSSLLARIAARLTPGATLAVLPEGVMVNYLARRINPTPYVNLMPPELLMFGEARILEAFRAAPPDFILLTNRDATDYGLGMLGSDHGRALMGWVQASFELVETIHERTAAGQPFSYGLLLRARAGTRAAERAVAAPQRGGVAPPAGPGATPPELAR